MRQGFIDVPDGALRTGMRCVLGEVPPSIVRELRTGDLDDETRTGFYVSEIRFAKKMFEYLDLQNMATRCMGAA